LGQSHDHKGRIDPDSGQVSGWIIKLVVSFFIVAVAIMEVGAVLVSKATVQEATLGAAAEAAFAIKTQGVNGDPETLARAYAKEKGSEFVSITYDKAARTVTVKLSRKAKTLFIHRFDYFSKYTTATSSATKSYAT